MFLLRTSNTILASASVLFLAFTSAGTASVDGERTSSTTAHSTSTVAIDALDPDITLADLDQAVQSPSVTGVTLSTTKSACPPIASASKEVRHYTNSRGLTPKIVFEVTNGTFKTYDNHTFYPIPVGKSVMRPFFQNTHSFALSAYTAGELGNESNHNYFRYTSRDLSMVAISYGEGDTGDKLFNWGDFANIAAWLYNMTSTPTFADNNATFSGKVQTSDHVPVADFYVAPSLGDVEILDPKTIPSSNGGAINGISRRHRLRKRVVEYHLEHGYLLHIQYARTNLDRSILGILIRTAMNQLAMDTSVSQIYRQFVARSPSFAPPGTPGTDFQMVFPYGVGRELIRQVLGVFIDLANRRGWGHERGIQVFVPAIVGQIIDPAGAIIGRLGLGTQLEGVFQCLVEQPDGSAAIGCFTRQIRL